MSHDVHYSSAKGDWQTPEHILERVQQVGPIGLDPCTTVDNPCKAELFYYLPDFDGLVEPWAVQGNLWMVDGLIYVNPPYGRGIGDWVVKCAGARDPVIALLPARPDTRWFQAVWQADRICFLRGRIKFVGAKANAPFPNCIALWTPRDRPIWTQPLNGWLLRFDAAFGPIGQLVRTV